MIFSDFQVVLPKYRISQEEAIAWLTEAHFLASGQELQKSIEHFAAKPKNLNFRYTALEDFSHTDWDRMRLFNLKQRSIGANLSDRMKFFDEVVFETFQRLYAEEQVAPEHLIHVTCTGYISPSGAQRLVSQKNWNQETMVTHLYHMGCYASIPAVRLAQNPKRRIDIVNTELCTLHFDPSSHSPEQLVVQGLFADGFIRFSSLSQDTFQARPRSGLEFIALREE